MTKILNTLSESISHSFLRPSFSVSFSFPISIFHRRIFYRESWVCRNRSDGTEDRTNRATGGNEFKVRKYCYLARYMHLAVYFIIFYSFIYLFILLITFNMFYFVLFYCFSCMFVTNMSSLI